MAINEKIITGRKFRRLIDTESKLWQRISWWTKSSDVEFDDGKTAEQKLGNINGISSDPDNEREDVAASMKALSLLKMSFQDGVNQLYDLLVKLGFTPNSKSLEDILAVINQMHEDRFEQGKSASEGILEFRLSATQNGGNSDYGGNLNTPRYVYENIKIKISNGSAKLLSGSKSKAETPSWLSDGINNSFYAIASISNISFQQILNLETGSDTLPKVPFSQTL